MAVSPPELDRQGPGLDGLDALPAALGVGVAADDVLEPAAFVFFFVVGAVGGGWATGLDLWGWEALEEEARVFRGDFGAVFGVRRL